MGSPRADAARGSRRADAAWGCVQARPAHRSVRADDIRSQQRSIGEWRAAKVVGGVTWEGRYVVQVHVVNCVCSVAARLAHPLSNDGHAVRVGKLGVERRGFDRDWLAPGSACIVGVDGHDMLARGAFPPRGSSDCTEPSLWGLGGDAGVLGAVGLVQIAVDEHGGPVEDGPRVGGVLVGGLPRTGGYVPRCGCGCVADENSIHGTARLGRVARACRATLSVRYFWVGWFR